MGSVYENNQILNKAKCLALIAEKDIPSIAAELGVNRSTIYRWRADDAEFRAKWDETIDLMYQSAMNTLAAKAEQMNRVLVNEAENGDEKVQALKLYYSLLERRNKSVSGSLKVEFDF